MRTYDDEKRNDVKRIIEEGTTILPRLFPTVRPSLLGLGAGGARAGVIFVKNSSINTPKKFYLIAVRTTKDIPILDVFSA